MVETKKCRADVVGRDGKLYICQKPMGHKGEHFDSREGYWTNWSDRDAERRRAQLAKIRDSAAKE